MLLLAIMEPAGIPGAPVPIPGPDEARVTSGRRQRWKGNDRER